MVRADKVQLQGPDGYPGYGQDLDAAPGEKQETILFDWMSWSLARRRAYWAGEVTCDPKDLRRRDRIAAIEVWCELYNKPPKDSTSRDIRGINEVLASLPGWRKRTVRVGACYGPTHGFVRDD